ncbi:GntR family transcriptional repressor for pyruvate dehydrogenase complex [Variovorax sp. GrIS 2.14]|uniref:FadR/GntR family transcriptional regulator n=1 Tax=Variovorax sp. GrIS 2.14 TaxID=3071709 RepID=UPI0038F74863
MARIEPTHFVFQPVQLVRPCEIVAYRITEAIRAGDVCIGERLPSELKLSEQLGVSRPTLREAIKLLVQAEIVQVVAGSAGGLFVIGDAVPVALSGLPLPESPMEDIDSAMEARRLFEPQVARMAALHATPADLERMRSAVALSKQISALPRKGRVSNEVAKRMTVASTRFNIAVARATQNSIVVQMMEVLMRRMELVRVLAVRALPDIALSTQTLTNSLRAIESGDPARIDRATVERIEILEAAWHRVSGKALRHRRLDPASYPDPFIDPTASVSPKAARPLARS